MTHATNIGDDTVAVVPLGLGKVLKMVADQLKADRIGAGSLAELRRMTPEEFPPAFWRLYFEQVPETWREPDGRTNPKLDAAWNVVVRAMAEMAPRALDFNASFGGALADTDYSESRFIRLLRAERRELPRELWNAARWLSLKGRTGVNWRPAAELALATLAGRGLPVSRRGASHRLARDYFRAERARS